MMRILRGRLKNKKLPIHDRWVRPTSAYRRELIFNRIEHAGLFTDFSKANVVDVFAGTGALGLEALSRGAQSLTLIEKSLKTHEKLKHFLNIHNLENTVRLLNADACSLPQHPPHLKRFNLCFLDAPYNQNLIPGALDSLRHQGWLDENAILIMELDKKESCPLPPWLKTENERLKGRTRVLFLKTS